VSLRLVREQDQKRAGSTESIQLILTRTFVVAHFLTGRIDLAEKATLEAIDIWSPDVENGDDLFRHGVTAALKRDRKPTRSALRDEDVGFLPEQLQAVMHLKPGLRRAFALSILAGFAPSTCAELLGLPLGRVETYTRAAIAGLVAMKDRRRKRGGSVDNNNLDENVTERLAYQFWLARGCPMGSPDEDWFRAESILRSFTIAEFAANAACGGTAARAPGDIAE